MQQHLAVPPGLVQSTYRFESGVIRQQWRRRKVASHGSISEISFRLVNLRAAVKNGEITDSRVIRDMALGIDRDLETWRAGVPVEWRYTVVDGSHVAVDTENDTDNDGDADTDTDPNPDPDPDHPFEGKTHTYPTLWIAEAWTNWRILRILANQVVVQTQTEFPSVEDNNTPVESPRLARRVIRQLSTDVCISVSSFTGTSRKFSSESLPCQIPLKIPHSIQHAII